MTVDINGAAGRAGSKGARDVESAMKIGINLGAEITVSGKSFAREIQYFHLVQPINDHHQLTIGLHRVGDQSGETISVDELSGILGKPLTLKTSSANQQVANDKLLSFTGTVTEVRFESSVDQFGEAVIVAKSPTVLLDGAPKNRVFEQMKASDAISQVIGQYKVTSGSIEATQSKFPYIIQYHETDFDFVVRLAALHGLYTVYDGSSITCVAADNSKSSETVKWNEMLGAFSLNLGTGPFRYSSASYNPAMGKLYVSDEQAVRMNRSLGDLPSKSEKAAKEIYEGMGISDVGMTAHEQALLDNYMKWERGHNLAQMVRCVGQASLPAIRPGTRLKVEGLDGVADVYFVEHVEHFISGGKYYNIFSGTPLATAYPRPRRLPAPQPELQTAVVTDVDDPEKLGRIKVKFNWPTQLESDWMRFTTGHAGDKHGFYMLPEINDEVLVGFEHGDPSAPIAIAALYNKNAMPDADLVAKDNMKKGLTTKSGHRIVLTDEGGAEKIEIITKDKKCEIVLDAAKKAITISTEGDITLKGQNITVDAGQKLILKSGTDTEIKAGANLKQEASASAEVKANATLDLKASGPVTVKGAVINLN